MWPEPADAVPVAQAILQDAFPSMHIKDEMPETRPAEFIVINRIGGEQTNPKQDRATLLIEFWASSSAVAAANAKKGRAALRNAKAQSWAGVFCYGFGNESGPTDLNDPKIQDRRRCQLVGDLLLSTA